MISNSDLFEIVKKVVDSDILFCSLYGSIVYGTWIPDVSDYDIYVIVSGKEIEKDVHGNGYNYDGSINNDTGIKLDFTIKSLDRFNILLNNCEVEAIEMMMIPNEYVLCDTLEIKEKFRSGFVLSKETKMLIRNAFSKKSDWSQDRANKKLKDGEYKLAIRSLYHSYRIIKFALQIAEHNNVIDWKEANDMWQELSLIPKENLTVELLKELYKKYVKNGLLTEFKNKFPK